MINNNIKTATKFTLLISLGLIGVSFVLVGISKKISKNRSATITLNSSIIESMVFLTTSDNKQLLPWNPQDGNQSVTEFYHAELKKHEDTLWQEATEKFGLDREKFIKQLKLSSYDFSNTNAQRSGKLSKETIAMTEDILKQCGLNPKTVEIVGRTKKGTSPAVANHKTIFINENEFQTYCPEAVRFIVAHETMHIKNQDGMAEGLLRSFLGDNNQLTKEQEKFVNKFCRFQETRADLQAVLTNKELAQGGVAFFDQLMKTSNCATRVHPKNSDRIELCQTVTAAWQLMPLTHL